MWEQKEYSAEKADDMREMIEEQYGNTEIAHEEFLQHQYFMNPAGNALIKLAYDTKKDVLAGQYVTIPIEVRVKSRDCRAVLSLNTLTRESYRGQQIFTTLAAGMFMECENTDIQFCYGFPNPNSYSGFINRLGFQVLGTMPLYIRIFSPFKIALKKIGIDLPAEDHRSFSNDPCMEKCSDCYRIVEIDKSNMNFIDVFWKMVRDKYPIMGIRDKQYMLWRYLEIPIRGYTIKMIFDRENPVGYLIYRITCVDGIQCGMIVDFLILEGKKAAAKYLIDHVVRKFREEKVELSGCLMQKHFEEAEILRKAGYFICPKFLEPQPFPVILRILNDKMKMKDVGMFQDWFLTMGDYDAI